MQPSEKPRYKPFESKYYSAHGEHAAPSMPGRFFRLGDELAGTTLLEVDAELERYRLAKKAGRQWDGERERNDLTEGERQAVASRLLGDGRNHAALGDVNQVRGLDELVSLIQEDLVVMRKEEHERGEAARAAYVNVSFPSGWCPVCVRGAGFSAMHARVPEQGTFLRRHRGALAEHLWPKGVPKVRFVWTLTPGDELSRQQCHASVHPSARLRGWDDAVQCFLRVERQVIVTIDARLSAFLIRVYVHEVSALEVSERARLLQAVESISKNQSVARYKGFESNLGRLAGLLAEARNVPSLGKR